MEDHLLEFSEYVEDMTKYILNRLKKDFYYTVETDVSTNPRHHYAFLSVKTRLIENSCIVEFSRLSPNTILWVIYLTL